MILVHAGVYSSDRLHYMNGAPAPGYLALATVFDGTYYLTQSGTADKPIVIKGAGDGEVDLRRRRRQNLFNLMAANYNYFEGITVRNTNVAFLLGHQEHRRRERLHAEALADRERRPRRAGRLVAARRISTSPTTCSSAATIPTR